MQPEIEEALRCPQCGAAGEPEQDGDLLYFECPQCGALFGYRQSLPNEPVCPAGLPLSVVAGAPQPSEAKTVFLGTTISRRPDD